MSGHGVNRRDAIKHLAAGIGATSMFWIDNLRVLAQQHTMDPRVVDAVQAPTWKAAVFSAHQLATVGVLVDLILPATDTPGATALLVDRYIDATLASADADDRNRFLSGLAWLDGRSQQLFHKAFVSASPAQQTNLLTRLSDDASSRREDAAGVEFFTAIKTLTIAGYYTTDVGLRQELGDDGRMVLAAFEGCTHDEHQ